MFKENNPLAGSDPVKAYMIHDPVENKWFRTGIGGFTGWDVQTKGSIWTVKKDAERILGRLAGTRAGRCLIKTFILIPADK